MQTAFDSQVSKSTTTRTVASSRSPRSRHDATGRPPKRPEVAAQVRSPAVWRRRVLAFVILLAAGGLIGAFAAGTFKAGLTPAQKAALRAERQTAKLRREVSRDVAAAASLVDVAAGTTNNASASPTIDFLRPMHPVEVLGFIPYWTASTITSFELRHVSEVALFGVEVGPEGNFIESGPGWSDYAANGYQSLVSEAHAARDRVLFTITTTRPQIIRRLVMHPAPASVNLARALSGAVASGGLDGVDIDIEGSGQSGRAGFVTFVRDLVRDLRADNMRGEIVLDTYPQSAGDSSNFFDVAKLAPYVDRVFIMGYDMEQFSYASPTAPLYASNLGLSDVLSLLQYAKVVPADKLILGVPFYGVDFTAAGGVKGAQAIKPFPTEVTYEAILAAGHAPMWDATSRTAWTHFRIGRTWHQTWYDSPYSVALKRALAAHFGLAGVGVWALGFEGNATNMLEALDGVVPPRHLALGAR